MAKEHHYLTRLKKLLPVFNAYFDRTATVKQATPPMHGAVADIIKSAQIIQTGLGHMDEAFSDSPELTQEFTHITQIALALPDIFESDGSFWGYLLNLVNLQTFRGGAEWLEVEQIDNFIQVLQDVKMMKLKIGGKAESD